MLMYKLMFNSMTWPYHIVGLPLLYIKYPSISGYVGTYHVSYFRPSILLSAVLLPQLLLHVIFCLSVASLLYIPVPCPNDPV